MLIILILVEMYNVEVGKPQQFLFRATSKSSSFPYYIFKHWTLKKQYWKDEDFDVARKRNCCGWHPSPRSIGICKTIIKHISNWKYNHSALIDILLETLVLLLCINTFKTIEPFLNVINHFKNRRTVLKTKNHFVNYRTILKQ